MNKFSMSQCSLPAANRKTRFLIVGNDLLIIFALFEKLSESVNRTPHGVVVDSTTR